MRNEGVVRDLDVRYLVSDASDVLVVVDVGGHREPMQRDNMYGECTESSSHSRA